MHLALPAFAALLLPLNSAVAQRSSDCATLAVLTDPRGDISKLGLALRRDGTMDLTASGKSDVVTGADDCDFEGPADEFTVECEWSANSHGAAQSRFNFLRVTLDTCLEVEFELDEVPSGSDAYRVLREFAGSVETGGEDEDQDGEDDGEDDEEYAEVDISLKLVERIPEGRGAEYSVTLESMRF